MIRLLVVLAASMSVAANAAVIRHDVDDAKYRIAASEFTALVDMPGAGHGTLIAPRWVVTAAHTIQPGQVLQQVVINGQPRAVERVVVHPGYKAVPQDLVDQAMATGEAVLFLTFLAASDDIALIKLKDPVSGVEPVRLYTGSDEFGQIFRFLGKGATGVGTKGHSAAAPQRTELRQGFNKVTSAHDRWFCYQFDEGLAALPLEAIGGNGDSGGPALIEADGQWLLAGMMSWKFVEGDVRTSRPGRYGQINCNVRLSHYRLWIESEMASIANES